MEERRKYPRLNLNVEVRWKKVDGEAGDALSHRSVTKNISTGGIRLILGSGVQMGDVLALEMGAPGGKAIRVKGKVIWVEKFEIIGVKNEIGYEGGIEFLDMAEEVKQEIANLAFNPRNPQG